jgi:hypothetical protein
MKFFKKIANQLPLDVNKTQGAFVQNKSVGELKQPKQNKMDPNKEVRSGQKMRYDIK